MPRTASSVVLSDKDDTIDHLVRAVSSTRRTDSRETRFGFAGAE